MLTREAGYISHCIRSHFITSNFNSFREKDSAKIGLGEIIMAFLNESTLKGCQEILTLHYIGFASKALLF